MHTIANTVTLYVVSLKKTKDLRLTKDYRIKMQLIILAKSLLVDILQENLLRGIHARPGQYGSAYILSSPFYMPCGASLQSFKKNIN